MNWQWSPTKKQFEKRVAIETKWELAKMRLEDIRETGYVPAASQQRQFAELPHMSFSEYIGQENAVERLRAAITAAKRTGKPLPHCALIGPAGMGKTSLASCAADSLDRPAFMTVGSALTNIQDVASLVDAVNGGIAFVDEAHDLARADLPIVSGLLPLLQDFMLHTETGSRPVVPFTMIFATTTFGLLDPAIRSRMGIPYELSGYTAEELSQIAQFHARKQGIISLPESVAQEVARRCRGNPRMCGNLVGEINNFTLAAGGKDIILNDALKAFSVLGIDENGFNKTDWRLLNLLKERPCAISRCAGYLGMDKRTFEEIIFPFLFNSGLVITSSKGLELTTAGTELVDG